MVWLHVYRLRLPDAVTVLPVTFPLPATFAFGYLRLYRFVVPAVRTRTFAFTGLDYAHFRSRLVTPHTLRLRFAVPSLRAASFTGCTHVPFYALRLRYGCTGLLPVIGLPGCTYVLPFDVYTYALLPLLLRLPAVYHIPRLRALPFGCFCGYALRLRLRFTVTLRLPFTTPGCRICTLVWLPSPGCGLDYTRCHTLLVTRSVTFWLVPQLRLRVGCVLRFTPRLWTGYARLVRGWIRLPVTPHTGWFARTFHPAVTGWIAVCVAVRSVRVWIGLRYVALHVRLLDWFGRLPVGFV